MSIVPWAVNSGSGIYPVGTWTFVLHQLTFSTPGLHVHLQVSTNPADTNSWNNFSGGGELISFSQYGPNPSGTWQLDTTDVSVGPTIYFRAVASAPGYLDSYSSAQGPYNITPPLPPQIDQITGDLSLSLSNYPGANSGHDLRITATDCATVQLSVSGNTTISSTIGLQGSSGCGGVNLNIAADGRLNSSRTDMRNGATLENKGTVNGPLTLEGGNLTQHQPTKAAIVGQGAGNIVAQGAGNIVAQGAGNIVAQGAGNIVAQGRGNTFSPRGKTPENLFQPDFTGQMIVNGDYNQFAGTLIVGIAGTNTLPSGVQQFDQLVVHGNANLVGGTIAFGLFNPNEQTNRTDVFLPPDGSTFDVVVATNIFVDKVQLRGLLWGDGLFFTGNVVARNDGLQALRLTATHVPPLLYLVKNNTAFQLAYATNYVGYAVESSDSLQSETNWTTYSFGTNVVDVSSTNGYRFFRLNH